MFPQLQAGDVPKLVAGLVGDEPLGGIQTCLGIQTQAKATEPSWVYQTPSELHEGGGPLDVQLQGFVTSNLH